MNRPTRRVAAVLVLGIVAAAAVLGWLLLGRPDPRPVAGAPEPAETAPPAPPPTALPSPSPAPAPKVGPTIPASAVAAAAPPQSAVPRGALRAALEREVPDGTAAQAEERIRAIFKEQKDSDAVFRHVLCTRSVCRIDLRWSPELSDAYNGGLIKVVQEFSREIAFEPDGELGTAQLPIPMNVYVARPGHSVESLLAEEAAAGAR